MTKTLIDGLAAVGAIAESQAEIPGRAASRQMQYALLALAAFVLYWSSSIYLVAREGTKYFGADTWFYTELAKGDIFSRLASNYLLDRIYRFHPTTVALAAGWMEAFEPLTPLIPPPHLLRAMFAFIGALGVWAALQAFAAIVPRRQVMLLGTIYATSLSVWYFSSIEESKIVTSTLIALYIALYLRLRSDWTLRGAALLTVILLLACLNEIVAGLLVLIPAVDTLALRGWDLRAGRWIAAHALAGPAALAIVEFLMRGRAGAADWHPEGANHFSMLVWYLAQNDYSAANLYAFAVRWLFFSIAAPWPGVDHPDVGDSHFDAELANYFTSPVSAALVALFGAMLLAMVLPRWRGAGFGALKSVALGLAAFALVRGLFFLVFIPKEGFIFSSSVTLTHLLLLAIPFAASDFPWKRTLLGGIAALLFLVNATFIIGQ